MGGDPPIPGGQRAHAVGETPVDTLLARVDELARRWAIALILDRRLERIGEVPLEDIAHEAPALFAQAIRALQSDAELERLAAVGVSRDHAASTPVGRLATLAGARSGSAVVEAVEALRGVLWEALVDELGSPSLASAPAELVAALGDRLAFVCATALAAAVAQDPAVPAGRYLAGAYAVPGASGRNVTFEPDRSHAARRTAVLVDELRSSPAEPRRDPGAPRDPRAPRDPGPRLKPEPRRGPEPEPEWSLQPHRMPTRPRARPWDTPVRPGRTSGSLGSPQAPPSVGPGGVDAPPGGPVMRVRRRTAAPADERN